MGPGVAEEYGRGPDAQELHDWMTRDRKPVSPGSRKRLQRVLAAKLAPLGFDPIVQSLQARDLPVTRASYLDLAGWTEPLTPELEATMPSELRHWPENP